LQSGVSRGFPFYGVLEQDAEFDELIASLGCSNEIAPIELEAFGDRAGKLIAAASTYQPVGPLQLASSGERDRIRLREGAVKGT
jgi:hypothetical protein